MLKRLEKYGHPVDAVPGRPTVQNSPESETVHALAPQRLRMRVKATRERLANA